MADIHIGSERQASLSANHHNEIVGRKLADENIDPAILRDHPYTICAVEDFELAIQVIQQTGIHVFMDKKITGEHRLWEMYSFVGSTLRDECVKVRCNLFPEDWRQIHPALGYPD